MSWGYFGGGYLLCDRRRTRNTFRLDVYTMVAGAFEVALYVYNQFLWSFYDIITVLTRFFWVLHLSQALLTRVGGRAVRRIFEVGHIA